MFAIAIAEASAHVKRPARPEPRPPAGSRTGQRVRGDGFLCTPGRGGAGEVTQRLALGELRDHLGYLVRRLQVGIFQDFIRTLAPMDVRPAQYSVLLVIAANRGRSQAAIGRALGIERARLARLLHELER